MMNTKSWWLFVLVLALWCVDGFGWQRPVAAAGPEIFEKPNLVAWCIVPFDDRERTSEERAAMLEKLGIRKLAYDYRANHIPTFDAELEALQRHKIELTAWWFPGALNEEAKLILEVLKRHDVKTQLWVTGGGEPTNSPEEQQARVKAEVERIRPLAEAAAAIGCSIGLYNHGGWFGEPENQIAIIHELKLPNVGIVYNQHHGHGHVARFAELLQLMLPHLYCLNLNGMVPDGEAQGMKIVPLGVGELDVRLLKIIQESGYAGPIGILNHTQENAELRLLDNLDGLEWLTRQLDGSQPGPQPKYRTWQRPTPQASANGGEERTFLNGGVLLEGHAAYRQFPLTVECTAKLTRQDSFNILVASDTKQSGAHWELFSMSGNGLFTVYLPGCEPDHVRSNKVITDGRTHQLKMVYETARMQLFVDGEQVADQAIKSLGRDAVPGMLGIGRLVEGGLYCHGQIDAVTITQQAAAESNLLAARPLLSWQAPESATSQTPVRPYDPAYAKELLEAAKSQGDALRGAQVFASAKFACVSCHRIRELGGTIGPELTAAAMKRTDEHLVESVLWPKQKIDPEYVAQLILTNDGRLTQGYVVQETKADVVLKESATGQTVAIPLLTIEDRKEIGTLMPDGLAAAMSHDQQLDLLRLIVDLRSGNAELLQAVEQIVKRSQVHAPVAFAYERGPLLPEHWPSAGEFVNRDRIYDFYLKEALHFCEAASPPPLVPAFPGLDGGAQGHWGNQTEPTWADGRWNDTVLGAFQAGVFHGDGKTVKRGVCVRLGDNGELAACFDPETLSYPVLWKTEGPRYVTFSDVRHGFMHGLIMNGTSTQSAHSGAAMPLLGKPVLPVKYQGFYRHENRVLFAYRIGEVDYLDAPWVNAQGEFERVLAPAAEHPLRAWTLGGPKQWDWQWETAGRLGSQSGFAVDTIPLPTENPWKALMFCGGHDFLADGSALVGTMQGDVWQASGLTAAINCVKWTRFASGLHHVLGMVIVPEDATRPEQQAGIFAQCRDQLLRLHDLNHDGEADFYECFSNAFETSPAGHDFLCGLERDAQGRFYMASGNQGLVRISADGAESEILATGFRNPDGLGLTAKGLLTIPCSEGDWTPASMICATQVDMSGTAPMSNVTPPYFGYPGARNGEPPMLPLIYLPRGLDNSAGGQVEIQGKRWQALAGNGNSVHLSFGQGTAFLLLHDEVQGQLQGAVMPLQTEFLSGAHRGRFHPRDGHLYVTGMSGWGSYTPDDGCLQRIRYQADSAGPLPVGFHVHENGILIEFDRTLPAIWTISPPTTFAQCWNYRYSGAYGSPELSPSHPGTPGHDVLQVAGTHVVQEGQSLFVEIPELQPVNQLHLLLPLEEGIERELFFTVHALDVPFTELPGYQPRQKTIAAHPMLIDMALALRSIPNPWLKRNHQARKVTLETGSNLTFATRSFKAAPGEAIALTLKNPDVVPHNWALVMSGTLQTVGEAANRLIADPEAVLHQYVPDLPEVLAYTDIVPPGGEFTIWIKAPETPGRYPYLCTFPGHWMVMNGELIVE